MRAKANVSMSERHKATATKDFMAKRRELASDKRKLETDQAKYDGKRVIIAVDCM